MPASASARSKRHHVLDELRRQADRRLVDQEHPRPQEQRAADLELLLLAAGHRRRLIVDALADPWESERAPPRSGRELGARQRDPAELEIVSHRKRAEQVAPLRHERDAVGEELARRLAVDAFPSKRTSPERGTSIPNSVFRTVDLPAPFGPMSSVISPLRASSVVSFRIVRLGEYPATTLSNSMIAFAHGQFPR